MEQKTYDVAIIGSGLPGSMLGAILAHGGASVILLDPRQHPRFTLGESVTPRTAIALRALAVRYGIPEIRTLTTFDNCSLIINSSFGVRKHYGFLTHHEGRPQDPREMIQASNGPLADPPHLLRQDSDLYMFNAALRYGCEARQNYRITDIDIDDSGVTINGGQYRARYIVDAFGRSSPLADHLAVRQDPPRLRHQSWAQWTHMIDVRNTDDVLAGRDRKDTPPIPWHEGTVCHVLDDGAIWVIPFGNHGRSRSSLCSVGMVLGGDPPDGTPAEVFARRIERYPDIKRQFDVAVPVREWENTGRLQYSSSRTVGDRWCLLGESAGFADHLFFRQLSDTAESLNVLAWRLLEAVTDDDFSAGRFAGVDQLQQGLLDFDDDLVRSCVTSFSDFGLWNAVCRVWAWGSGAGTFRLQEAMAKFAADGRDEHFRALEDVPYPGFIWPDHEGFRKLFEEMVSSCAAYGGGRITGSEAAAEVRDQIQASDFIPRHLGFAELDQRFLHATPKDVIKSLRWAAKEADPELKRLLVTNVRHVAKAKITSKLPIGR